MGEIRRYMGETWGRYGEICGRYDLHDDVRRRDEPPRQRLHLGRPPNEEKRLSLVAEERTFVCTSAGHVAEKSRLCLSCRMWPKIAEI